MCEGRGRYKTEHTKSAKYVSIFEDWMEFLLLKLKSCAFLHQALSMVSVFSTADTETVANTVISLAAT